MASVVLHWLVSGFLSELNVQLVIPEAKNLIKILNKKKFRDLNGFDDNHKQRNMEHMYDKIYINVIYVLRYSVD